MRNVLHALIVAFSEILKWDTIKIVLLSGILVTVLWAGIGWMVWDHLIALSAKILEFVPFSMIRSNGAWMLSAFLWFQLVLVTFALVYAFFGNLILRVVSKEKYSTFTFLTVFLAALFWMIVWFFAGDYIYDQFLRLMTWLPFETIEKGLAFLIALYLIYNAIIVSMLFIASLFSEPIIKMVEKRHFAEEEVIKENIFSSLRYTVRDTVIFIGVSIVAFPLLFVPVVNLLVQIILWVWLTKDTISYDALSLVYKKPDKALIKQHRIAIFFITFVTVLFNFIPIFNLFGPFFGEIAMFHYFKSLKKS
ncbi:MAG: hypothetical protein DSZ10_01620 [Sulfurovum sp.]|nr:MAG: hypothetical protein DSZ10_01620 [Sulfurovum sp.]